MLSVTKLTNGEKLFTLRRRSGNTQTQEAKDRGLPLTAYKMIEVDQTCDWNLPAEGVGKLSMPEICVTLRRRKEMTLDQLSYDTGLSKWYLCLIEKGNAPVDTLVKYWDSVSSAVA